MGLAIRGVGRRILGFKRTGIELSLSLRQWVHKSGLRGEGLDGGEEATCSSCFLAFLGSARLRELRADAEPVMLLESETILEMRTRAMVNTT